MLKSDIFWFCVQDGRVLIRAGKFRREPSEVENLSVLSSKEGGNVDMYPVGVPVWKQTALDFHM